MSPRNSRVGSIGGGRHARPIPFADVAAVDAGSLANAKGGTNINTNTTTNNSTNIGALTDQDLSATNTGNNITAGLITNGTINIGTGAFSGFNGVGNFVLNTGTSDNIQGSLSVSIVLSPLLTAASAIQSQP